MIQNVSPFVLKLIFVHSFFVVTYWETDGKCQKPFNFWFFIVHFGFKTWLGRYWIREKLSISPNCFIALKFISLVQLKLVNCMRTRVCQCVLVNDSNCKCSEVKWVMAGYCEHCETTLEELYSSRTGPQTHSDREHSAQFHINFYSHSCSWAA